MFSSRSLAGSSSIWIASDKPRPESSTLHSQTLDGLACSISGRLRPAKSIGNLMKISNTAAIARLALVVCFLFVAALQPATAKSAFSKLVVFGDSLNDSGNMVQFTGGVFPAPPNYAYGRQSNGPVWVEYFAQRLELTDRVENYAVVGALLKPRPGYGSNAWSDTFSGLDGTDVTSQIIDFLSESNWQADPRALYVLEGGANDFFRLDDKAVIVADTLQALVMLEMYGAKHIVLVNMPDWGRTPRVIMSYKLGLLPPGVTPAMVSAGCAAFNQAVLAYLPGCTFPGVKITTADMYQFLGVASASVNPYGFTHTEDACLLFGGPTNPDEWLFWDDIHPTTRGHEYFSNFVIESLVRTYSPGKGHLGNGEVESLNGLVNAPGRQ
jgi:phospholipase/lecithinase/hemolysin